MPNHVCVSPSGKARELYEKIQKEYPEASKRDNLNLTKVCQWIGLYNTYKNKDIDFVPSAKTLVNYIERLRNTSGKSFLNTSDVQFAVESNPASSFNISTAEFYSGDAKGADKEWGAVARAAGIKVTDYTPEDWDALPAAEKNRFNAQYNAVVNWLHRRPLDEDTLRGKFVRRDMMQVDKADSVLAVGVIVKPKEKGEKYVNTSAYEVVDGGTGYAVAQGIRKGIPVYVFDQGKNTWNVWDKDSNSFKPTTEPRLTQHAAVIGTRNINYSGRQAIKSVVSHTINPSTQQFSQPRPSVLSTEARKSLVDQFIVSLKSRGIKVGNAAEMERFLKRNPKAIPEIQEALEQEHEMQAIKEKAIADGTFMKAPNGNPTNLNERQWLQVRTKAFKKWFGDWERGIQVNQDNNSYYRGQYEEPIIDEDGNLILKGRKDSLYERAGYNIEKGVSATTNMQLADEYGTNQRYAYEADVEDKYGDFDQSWEKEQELNEIGEHGYYLVQFPKNISNQIIKENEEVKIVGDVVIPKGQYVIEHITNGGGEIIATADNNASKVVDENGEPLVVYRGDSNGKTQFNPTKPSYNVQGIYIAGNKTFASNYTKPSFYNNYTEGILYEVFVNAKNPIYNSRDIEGWNSGKYDTNDSWIYGNFPNGNGELVVRDPNQIKSATDNNGMFSAENNDIQMAVENNIPTTDEQVEGVNQHLEELKELSKEELSKDIKEYFESEEGTASLPEGVSDEEPPIDIEAEEEYIKRKEQEEKRRKLLEERAKKESSDPRVHEKFAGYHCQRAYYLLKRLKDMGSPYSDLIDILLPKLGSLGYIRIYLDEEGDLIRNGAVGMYYSGKNYITVSGRGTMPGKDGLIDGTVIHEVLHAFTMNSLRFRDNYNKLTDIYKEAKEKIFKKYNVNSLYEIKDPAVVRNLYGLTNPAEFISEFFTNAAFIKELNDENIFGEKDSKESVIHKILDWIKSLFGGTTDIYQRADEVIEDIVLNYGGHIIPSLYRVKRARMLKGEGKKPLADTPQAFEMTTPEGIKTVYGFYNHSEKKIYLDENIVDLDHGVHEFTHLWDRVLQETQPKLWKKGVELMQSKHLGLWNQIQKDPNYGGKWIKEGKSIEELTNLIASEVHSRIVGKKGKEFIEQKALEAGEVGKNFFEKLKNWILEAWKSIKATFSDWTDDEIAALSIDDFDNMTLRDLFSGINPFDAARRYEESRNKKQQPVEQSAQNPYKVEIEGLKTSKDSSVSPSQAAEAEQQSEPQQPSPEQQKIMEQFKKDIELLTGYYEGGGRVIQDDFSGITKELDDKLANYFMAGKELDIDTLRELWKVIEFGHGANNKVTYYKDKVTGNIYVDESGIADKTEAWGVEINPNLKNEYAEWQKKNPTGLIAYRVNSNKYNTPSEVYSGRIGNPFSEEEHGASSIFRFFDWLVNGNNYNNKKATEEYRQAIIEKILRTPNGAPILYYEELKRPSHATVIGYLVNNKQLLPQSQVGTIDGEKPDFTNAVRLLSDEDIANYNKRVEEQQKRDNEKISKPNSAAFESALKVKHDRKAAYTRTFSPKQLKDRGKWISDLFTDILDNWVWDIVDECDDVIQDTGSTKEMIDAAEARKNEVKDAITGRQLVFKEHGLKEMLEKIKEKMDTALDLCSNEERRILYQNTVEYLHELFFEQAVIDIEEREGIRIVGEKVDPKDSASQEMTNSEDNTNEDEGNIVDGNEGWGFQIRFSNPFDSLSKLVKSMLYTVERPDNQRDDLGFKQYYPMGQIYATFLSYMAKHLKSADDLIVINKDYEHKDKLGVVTGKDEWGYDIYEGKDNCGYDINDETYPEGYPTFPLLEQMAKSYPWVRQIIDRFTADYRATNDDIHFPYTGGSLVSQFYTNFKKAFIPYVKAILGDPRDTGKMTPLNFEMADRLQKDKFIANYNNRMVLTDHSIYDASGRIVKENVIWLGERMQQLAEVRENHDFSEYPDLIAKFTFDPKSVEDFTKEDIDLYNQTIKDYQELLQSFGIDASEEHVTALLVADTATLDEMLGKLSFILQQLEKVSDEDLKDFDYIIDTKDKYGTNLWAHFFDGLGMITDDSYMQSFYDTASKKTRYSYSADNFLQKVFRGVCMGTQEERRKFINETFGGFEWFRDQSAKEGEGWKNRWLEYWYNVEGTCTELPYRNANNVTVKRERGSNTVRDYTKWQPSDIYEIQNRSYDHDVLHTYSSFRTYCHYLTPVFADSPIAMTVLGPKMDSRQLLFGGERITGKPETYQRGALVDLVLQELWRIAHVQNRAKDIKKGKLKEIACFDKRGLEFCFIPELNDYKTEDGKTFLEAAVAIKEGIANGTANSRDLEVLIIKALDDIITQKCFDYYNEDTKHEDFDGVHPAVKAMAANKSEGKSALDTSYAVEYMNMMYANAAIIQMTCGDLAFSKNNVDFTKRFKQVYAGGIELNTKSKYGVENDVSIVLRDDTITSTTYKDIERIINSNKNLSDKDKDRILKIFRNINVADAQAFRAMHSYRSIMDMMGRWTPEMEEALNRFRRNEWRASDFDIVWQTIKPFAYSMISRQSSDGVRIAVPEQHKNSEICALAMLDFIVNDLEKSDVYTTLSEFMDETKGADGKQLIHMAQFESAVKTGIQSVLNISCDPDKLLDAYKDGLLDGSIQLIPEKKGKDGKKVKIKVVEENTNDLWDAAKKQLDEALGNDRITQEEYNDIIKSLRPSKEKLRKMLEDHATVLNDDGTRSINPATTYTMPFKNYYQQQPTPAHHIDNEAVFGSQTRNLIVADLPEDFTLTLDGKTGKEKRTKTYKGRDAVIDFYYELLNENLLEDFFGVDGKGGLKAIFSSKESLREAIEEIVRGNPKYSRDFMDALEIDEETGDFVLNINSPTMFGPMQEIVTSLFKNRITKQKINGAALIQAAGIGLDSNLHLVYEGDRVVGAQCYLPLTSREFFEPLLEDQTINGKKKKVLNLEKLKEAGLDKALGYRIPTENKSSMLPLIIEGFTPQQNGSIIILPAEITALAGSDFDVDKMFLMLLSFRVIKYNYSEALADYDNLTHTNRGMRLSQQMEQALAVADDEGIEGPIKDKEFLEWYKKNKENYKLDKPELQVIEYDFDKTPEENGRKARNNMLIQIMYKILTSKEGTASLLNPQGFPNLEYAAKANVLIHNNYLREEWKKHLIKKEGVIPNERLIKKMLIDAQSATMNSAELAALKQSLDTLSSEQIKEMYIEAVAGTINLEQVLESIENASEDEIVDFVSKHQQFESPVYPQAFQHSHARNMAGANQIGIYAIQSSNAAKYQRSVIKLMKVQEFVINGRRITEASESDNGKRVKGCGEMVGGSADNGKNPNLTDMGSTDKTAALIGYLLRCGLSHIEAALIVNNPIMIDAGFSYKSPIFKKYLGRKNPLREVNPENVTTNMLIRGDVSLEGLCTEDEQEQIAAMCYRILQQFEAIEYLNTISRADSPNGGMANTYAKARIQRYKVDLFQAKQAQNNFPFLRINAALSNDAIDVSAPKAAVREQLKKQPMAFLHGMYALGINSFNTLMGEYFFGAQKWFDERITSPILNNLNEYTSDNDKAEHVNNIYKAYITYKLSESELFGDEHDDQGNVIETMAQKRAWYLTEYPKEFIKALQEHKELRDLLGNILMVSNNMIVLQDVGSKGKEQRRELERRFESLLYSDNEEVRDTAKHLLLYSYYRDGLHFTPNSFSTLFTSRFLTSFPAYTNALKSLNDEVDEFQIDNFIKQFIVNNPSVTMPFDSIIQRGIDEGNIIAEEDKITVQLGPNTMHLLHAFQNDLCSINVKVSGSHPYKYISYDNNVYILNEEMYDNNPGTYVYEKIPDYMMNGGPAVYHSAMSPIQLADALNYKNLRKEKIEEKNTSASEEEKQKQLEEEERRKEEFEAIAAANNAEYKSDPVVQEQHPAAGTVDFEALADSLGDTSFLDGMDFYIEDSARQMSDSEKYESEGKTELEKEFC